MLPITLISLIQNLILFAVALLFGLQFSFNIILVIVATLPVSIIFSSLGLILGSIFNDKQASAISSLLIQVVAFTSGMWFDLNLVGGVYKTICYILPFANSVDLLKYILVGDYTKAIIPLIIVLGYMLLLTILSIITFKKIGTKK